MGYMMVIQWHKKWDLMGYMMIYPLVNLQKAMENGHRNSEFSHEKWWNFP